MKKGKRWREAVQSCLEHTGVAPDCEFGSVRYMDTDNQHWTGKTLMKRVCDLENRLAGLESMLGLVYVDRTILPSHYEQTKKKGKK